MFHSTPTSYPSATAEMTSLAAAGNTSASFHQTSNTTPASNTPVYVPSSRAIHSQYAGHTGNYPNTQNGWSPADSAFGKRKKIDLKKFNYLFFISFRRFTFTILCDTKYEYDVYASGL